jgi:hypothetical protein
MQRRAGRGRQIGTFADLTKESLGIPIARGGTRQRHVIFARCTLGQLLAKIRN